MNLTLRGDYFHGDFTHKNGITDNDVQVSDEKITKLCPGDTNNTLWKASIRYENVQKVIGSSIDGFNTWRKLSLADRIDFLKKFQTQVEKRKSDIGMAIALETGKPLWESKTEAAALSAKVNVTISDSLKRIEQQTIKEILPHIEGHVVYKPLGPTLVIGPYNFPCHLANGQILSALLTGNSIIFKPSEKTMYSSQLLIECFHQAGFPKGVVNFINGTAKTTQDILKHPAIRAIFFTGSHFVGKKILESVGTDVSKLVALELGGKNTSIIHSDADIEHTIPELLRACYLSSGQRCTSTSVILIHRSLEQEFIQKFKQTTQRIIVDHPTIHQVDPFMGPLVDEMALNTYNQSIAMGEKNGAEIILPNQRLEKNHQGYYISPSIHYLKEAKKENPFTQEEIFGPNATFIPYDDIEQAIAIANISDYGLAAAAFTQSKEIYNLCLRDIDAGIINLNRSTVGASSRLPFGGVKNSGNHHPAAVSMVDHTVSVVASLETLDSSSTLSDVKGLL
ncbi:MAG: aldehyde dehydrogenase family protein [Halobacteriovoraceae bacterium]|jgi:succinylglutamic semialdehyde dehydrogenase|nr:aldehyde dehydrogenase family protein [Halobacteriovoraceae bacterium]